MAKVVWKKLFYESVRFFTEMIKIHLLVSNKTFFIQTNTNVPHSLEQNIFSLIHMIVYFDEIFFSWKDKNSVV